jgi:threonine/homoserine/homoserine lactone efflux protein
MDWRAFWLGFLRGLGNPTAVIWGVALAAPIFAFKTPDTAESIFAVVLCFLCWLVIVGSWVRRALEKRAAKEEAQ